MRFSLTRASAVSQKLPTIILFAYENERPAGPPALRNILRSVGKKEFDGAEKHLLILHSAKESVARTQLVADSANYARDIGNLPGNVVYPRVLADYAKQLAKESRLKCTVYDKAALIRGKFGGLLAVGGGSAHDPRLIVL